MNYYYADADNQPQGPVTEEALKQLCNEGTISHDSFVIGEGETDWKTYRSICTPTPPPIRSMVLSPQSIRKMELDTITLVPQAKTQQCPFCAEEINLAAKKCKHCGETLDVALRAAEEAKRSNSNQPMVFMNAAGGGVSTPKKSFPHLIHLILTLFTGVWLFVWIFHYIFRSREKYG